MPEGLRVLDRRGVVSCETGAGAARCFAVYAIVANYGVLAPPVIRWPVRPDRLAADFWARGARGVAVGSEFEQCGELW